MTQYVTQFTIERNIDGCDVEGDVTVTYVIHGRYCPATWEDPAEYPEVEIVSVTTLDPWMVPHEVSLNDAEEQAFIEYVSKRHDPADGPDPDHARDARIDREMIERSKW